MAITSIKTGSSFTNLVKYNDFLGPNPAFNPSSFESIATLNGTGSSGILTFTSIPQTFKHLHIRGIVRNTASGTTTSPIGMRFNSAGGYSKHRLYGTGSSAIASGSSGAGNIYVGESPNNGNTANLVGVFYVDILDYTSTAKYKVGKAFGGVDNNGTGSNMNISLWSGAINTSLSAVTSLEFGDDNGYDFSTITQIALYGIK